MRSIAVSFVLVVAAAGCEPEASDAELRQMCEHLAELRGEERDEARTKQCVADARKEGVSRRQARCRATAINAQEYWNRCRTGEARVR